MIYLLLLNLVFGLIKSNTSNDYLRIDLKNSILNYWTLSYLLSGSEKFFNAIPDLNSSYSLLYEKEISIHPIDEGSIMISDTKIIYNGITINSFQINNTFEFYYYPDKRISLYYYVTKENSIEKNSFLALSYSYENENYSIIHQFKRKGFIDSLSFALIMSKAFQRIIYLGGIPSQYTDNKNYSFINVAGYSNQWDFYISEVNIKNETKRFKFSKRTYAYLISVEPFIYAPSEFFNILTDKYFNELILENQCHILATPPKRYLLCSINSKVRQGEISFLINDYIYLFKSEQLWRCGEEYCIFSIKENNNENEWAIGSDFYDLFNLLFDYEGKKVHLYLPKNFKLFIKDSKGSTEAKLTLVIIVFICSLIGISIVINIQLMLKKIKDKLNEI